MISNLNVKTQSILGNSGLATLTTSFFYQRHTQLNVFIQDETDPLNLILTALTWEAYDSMDLSVSAGRFKITGLTSTTPYEHGTGIEINAAIGANERIVVERVTPLVQEVDYDPTRVFPADKHEDQMDRHMMALQELDAGKADLDAQVAALTVTVAAGAAAILRCDAPSAGARDGTNRVFTLNNTPVGTGVVVAVVDGALSEVLTPVVDQVTVSVALAAELADPSIDLKFLYI